MLLKLLKFTDLSTYPINMKIEEYEEKVMQASTHSSANKTLQLVVVVLAKTKKNWSYNTFAFIF